MFLNVLYYEYTSKIKQVAQRCIYFLELFCKKFFILQLKLKGDYYNNDKI